VGAENDDVTVVQPLQAVAGVIVVDVASVALGSIHCPECVVNKPLFASQCLFQTFVKVFFCLVVP